ncbi:MAG TPA: plastocyanin/azurin family copper-binding protein [Pseudoneobacillus sp.]|nr:plastocyanin/azurin family copper-binding protein [Pseudoneobacillus sp.]
MSWFDYFVVATLSLVILISVIMSVLLRNQLNKMTKMMISMVIGMNVGLTEGLLFGSNYQGELYYSTLIAILVGVIAGTVCGLTFGVLPSLEGFMAGLMGGMMGAMLGEMITKNQADTIINIFLTLSVCSLFLFPILHESHEKESKRKNILWFVKPLFTFLLLSGYLLLGNQLDKQFVLSKSNSSHNRDHNHSTKEDSSHSNHGISELPNNHTIQEFTVNIHQSNFAYDPQKMIMKKGQQVRLYLTNHDSIEHDIEINHFPATIKSENHQGQTTNKVDLHLHASPNNQAKMIFTPLQNGIFEFYCTIPGHKERGMTGLIIVE